MMLESIDSIVVPSDDWIELYTASGIRPGTRLNLQVVGHFPVYVFYSDTKPTTEAGNILYPLAIVSTSDAEAGVWVTTTEAAKISSIKVEPSRSLSTPITMEGNLFSSANGSGRFYTGSSERTGVAVADPDYFSVITAGPSGLVIDDLIMILSFADVTDGKFSYRMSCFVESSSGNDWSYTPGTPTPIGRPLNTNFINDFPASTIDSDVAATVNTGNPDYVIFATDYFIDVGGNRNTQSKVDTNFFESGRQIFMGAGEKMLIQATVSGDAVGSADVSTIFFTSEDS